MLLAVLFFISVLAQGSFFGTTSIFLGLLLLLALFFRFQNIPPMRLTLLLLTLGSVYLLSASLNYFSFENLMFALRPWICLLFLTVVFQVEDREYLGKVVVGSGVVVACLGLFAFVGLLDLEGMVVARRLQSTFQYANATGAFLAACALLARGGEYGKAKNMILILETSLFLTQSVGALVAYFVCLSLGLVGLSTLSRTRAKRHSLKALLCNGLAIPMG